MKLFLILFFSGLTYGACASAWSNGYTYCRPVVIDKTKVPSTQTNFAVMVSSTVATWKTAANSGHVQNTVTSDGISVPADFIVTSDNAGTTLIAWEFEQYTATTGQAIFWVNIASVSSAADTEFYVFYGNAAVSTFQGNINGTWDANYLGVWHLKGSLGLSDSTSNALTLSQINVSNAVTAGTGQIDGDGTGWEGTQDRGLKTVATAWTAPLTFQCWVNATAGIPSGGRIGKHGANGADDGRQFAVDNAADTLTLKYVRGGVTNYPFSMLTFGVGAWVYTAITLDGTGGTATSVGYVGAAGTFSTQSQTVNGATAGATPGFLFGQNSAGANHWSGSLDECRISTSVRTADWLHTEYNNQFAPTTFLTIGTEVGQGTASGKSILLVGVN